MEFRHESWIAHAAESQRMLPKFDIIHIIDPLRTSPTCQSDIAYFRLHGLAKQLYKYTLQDLEKLKQILHNVEADSVYVMFNNVHMKDDALTFAKMVQT